MAPTFLSSVVGKERSRQPSSCISKSSTNVSAFRSESRKNSGSLDFWAERMVSTC